MGGILSYCGGKPSSDNANFAPYPENPRAKETQLQKRAPVKQQLPLPVFIRTPVFELQAFQKVTKNCLSKPVVGRGFQTVV
jgi:hypothetical protein